MLTLLSSHATIMMCAILLGPFRVYSWFLLHLNCNIPYPVVVLMIVMQCLFDSAKINWSFYSHVTASPLGKDSYSCLDGVSIF